MNITPYIMLVPLIVTIINIIMSAITNSLSVSQLPSNINIFSNIRT